MIAPTPPWQLDDADGGGNHDQREASGAIALRCALAALAAG